MPCPLAPSSGMFPLDIKRVLVFSLPVTLTIPVPPFIRLPASPGGSGESTSSALLAVKRIGAFFPVVDLATLGGYLESRNWPHPDLLTYCMTNHTDIFNERWVHEILRYCSLLIILDQIHYENKHVDIMWSP